MRKFLFPLLLIMSFLISPLYGQSYDEMWGKVATAQKKDLPREVLSASQAIYDKAAKEKNFPQLLKSWVTIVETKCELDPDSFRIANFPPLPHKTKVETALYNAIMGQAYLVMKDTHISENDADVQTDYQQKAKELFAEALSDKELLAKTSALDYLPLIQKGDDSRFYGHDLLSLLTRFVADHSAMTYGEKARLYGEVATFYKEQGNLEGYTLMKFKELWCNPLHEDYNQRLSEEDYVLALKALVEESKETETGVDVAAYYVDRISDKDERLDFARWAMQHYQAKSFLHAFENTEREILQPRLYIATESCALAKRPNPIRVEGSNLTDIKLVVREYNGRDKNYNLKTDGRIVLERSYSLCNDSLNTARRAKGYPTHDECTDKLTLPAGHYVYVATSGKLKTTEEVSITSLRLLTFSLPNNQVLAQVLDNETGRPVPGALLTIKDHDKFVKKLNCDHQGECVFDYDGKKYWNLSASIEGTRDQTSEISLHEWKNSPRKEADQSCHLFTDRQIYRPGQTVHISGILFSQQGDEVHTLAYKPQKISFFDANASQIGEKKVMTNELGSFSLDFVLPKELLPGRVRISSELGGIFIRVEEYKRPTFQVEAQAATGASAASFSFGDTIQVEAVAKTFAGVPVQGAKVHYKIESAEVSFWRWFDTNWHMLAQGDTLSNEAGKVCVPVFLNPQDLNDFFGAVRYRISFDVTDQAGETQSDFYCLAVSKHSFSLNIKAASEIDLSQPNATFSIQAINANQAEVEVAGTYTLAVTSTSEVVLTQSFQSNQSLQLPAGLAPGNYTLRASAIDRDGTEIITSSTLTLYDRRSALDLRKNGSAQKNAPSTCFNRDFVLVTQPVFSEQQAAQVLFSPVHDDVYLGYMIRSNDAVIERRQLTVGRQQYSLAIPYDKRYGDGVTVIFWYVRHGHLCQQQERITYQKPDKSLQLSWSTFRDKLYPGQQEEWILTIRDPQGRAVPGAELLATMYDASLDQLAAHSWDFGLSFARTIQYWNYRSSSENYSHTLSCAGNYVRLRNPERAFDELTQYIHDRYLDNYIIGYTGMASHRTGMRRFASAAPMMRSKQANYVMPDVCEALTEESVSESFSLDAAAVPESSASSPALRTNFAETAFFYPHLLSDANGDVKISFTLPESLTEWKFMGLAHTSDVRYGQLSARAVARKDFMVQPNMPRFVREGDKLVLSARVINQGETDLSGTALMRLIDPETEQVVFTDKQAFAVAQGQTTSVSFQASISDQYPMLICEVSGSTGSFSDGERNYLPVLSSKKYITEAIPFWISAEETEKQIDLSSLFNEGSPTATQRRLLLEFTQHPEWTVIQALDGIKLPEHDNAPCFAASLYANTLASRLAQSIPGFHEALLWAKSHNIGSSLPLEENQDLKEIVLSNSPWLRDALAEREQRSRLLDLFDSQLIDKRNATALDKLQKLQNADGSWSWFEGMTGNEYITLATCLHLTLLQSSDKAVQDMLQRGLKFLDQQEYEHYQYRLKHKLPLYAAGSLEYLYVCSYQADRPVGKDIQKMREAYLKEIEKQVRNFTIQGRAKAACVLRAFGHNRSANDFLESAVQYTITKPGMGRYYATDAAYYSWCDYRIPTQLATMRALRQSDRADRAQLINEMQLWLLRQKQTQAWDSPLNTIEAVDFLLHGATSATVAEVSSPVSSATVDKASSSASATLPRFTLGKTPLAVSLDTTKFMAAELGYIRTELPSELLETPLTTLTVADVTASASLPHQISWGAIYAQYLEDMDRLHQQSSGELKVSIRLLDADGKAVSSLKVGDQVTLRVSLTADRDMDFVQVRVQRPACFEPLNQLSGYRWMNGRGGYVAQHDASTDLFFDTFRKGTMTYDLTFHVDRPGEYLSGIATAQCAYSPEFSAHSAALRVTIKE